MTLKVFILCSLFSVACSFGGVEPKAKPASDETTAFVVVSHRRIAQGKMAAYTAGYSNFSKYMLDKIPGVKAAFFAVDKTDPLLVHDVQWFGDVAAFHAHTDMEAHPFLAGLTQSIMGSYDMSVPMTGDVFGAWDESVIAITTMMNAKFNFHKSNAGFIKSTGDDLAGPPALVASTRYLKDGAQDAYAKDYNNWASYMRDTIPGVIAVTSAPDDNDPNLVHDFQLYANMDVFMAHVNIWADPDPILMRNGKPALGSHYASVPFEGNMFSSDGNTANMITSRAGGNFIFYDFPVDIVGNIDLNKQ